MITIHLPVPFRRFAGGIAVVAVQGSTVGEALRDLERQFPALKPYLFDLEGGMQLYAHVFLGGEDVRSHQGEDTPIADGDEIRLVPSVANR